MRIIASITAVLTALSLIVMPVRSAVGGPASAAAETAAGDAVNSEVFANAELGSAYTESAASETEEIQCTYIISTQEELMNVKGSFSYRLSANIELDEEFEPIPSFSGTLDGNGYAISNITMPLFKVLDGADVHDLKLFTPGFSWDCNGASGESASVGVLAGKSTGAITLSDISVSIGGTVASSSSKANAGGLIGWIDGRRVDTSITRCSVTLLPNAAIYSPMSNNAYCAGGLFGSLTNTSSGYSHVVDSCYVYLAESSRIYTISSYSGGLCGKSNAAGLVFNNCYIYMDADSTIGSEATVVNSVSGAFGTLGGHFSSCYAFIADGAQISGKNSGVLLAASTSLSPVLSDVLVYASNGAIPLVTGHDDTDFDGAVRADSVEDFIAAANAASEVFDSSPWSIDQNASPACCAAGIAGLPHLDWESSVYCAPSSAHIDAAAVTDLVFNVEPEVSSVSFLGTDLAEGADYSVNGSLITVFSNVFECLSPGDEGELIFNANGHSASSAVIADGEVYRTIGFADSDNGSASLAAACGGAAAGGNVTVSLKPDLGSFCYGIKLTYNDGTEEYYDMIGREFTFCLRNADVIVTPYFFAALSYTAADGDSAGTSVIYPSYARDSWYLCLPASADYSSITLSGPENAVLTGTVTGDGGDPVSFGIGEALDLTALFGEMTFGVVYPLTLAFDSDGIDYACCINIVKASGLPSIHITIADENTGEPADMAYINSSKDNYVSSGSLLKVLPNGSTEVSVALSKLKGRGNGSFIPTDSAEFMNGYNITLSSKKPLVTGSVSAKKWCLVLGANEFDGFINSIAYKLYQLLGGSAPVDFESVDLYINGSYYGCYLLVKKVEKAVEAVDGFNESKWTVEGTLSETVNSPDDPAIAAGIEYYTYSPDAVLKGKSGGILLEIDNYYASTEPCRFKTRNGVTFVVKEPEFATREQVQTIAKYVQDFENAMFADSGFNSEGCYYADYIDMDSLARLMAVGEFIATQDFFYSSYFMYMKTDSDGTYGSNKLTFGPLWDIENVGNTGLLSCNTNGSTPWPEQLITKGDFMEALHDVVYGDLITALDLIKGSDAEEGYMQQWIDKAHGSVTMTNLRWYNVIKRRSSFFSPNNTTSYLNGLRNGLLRRETLWYDTLYDTNLNLVGVTTSVTASGLHALALGPDDAEYQWYMLTDSYELIAVDGAVEADFTPAESGMYYVMVTGSNPAYVSGLSDKVAGFHPLLNSQDYTMVSVPIEYSAPSFIWGDVNGDGSVSMQDITTLYLYMMGDILLDDAQRTAADIDGDGTIGFLDVSALSLYLLG